MSSENHIRTENNEHRRNMFQGEKCVINRKMGVCSQQKWERQNNM
jgi:hypothetical protein